MPVKSEWITYGDQVVLIEDECHVLWGDTLGSIWGRVNTTIPVPMTNETARQT